MSTLTGTKISDTYVGLLKTLDTTPLSETPKEISDGLGNASGVKLDNAGNLDVTNTVAFGSLKDTTEDITITKFVDEADGIGNNDDDTSIPTSAAVKDYVDDYITAQDLDFSGNSGTGDVDLDSEVFTITGSNGIETTALDNTLIIDGTILETGIATNATGIATNVTNIATNATNIASNDTDIANNTANIVTNATDIASNDTDINNLQNSVSTNTSNISSNTADIATNVTNISTNATNISTNATSISTNAANITSNENDIVDLQTDVDQNTTNIDTNIANIATNTANIASNDVDIATNATNIAANTATGSSNSYYIATNASNIATNIANITSNDVDIANNVADITTNAGNIATNTATGSTNAGNIDTNTTNISTNTGLIATNATDIATNTAGIATNTTAIATNVTSISTNTTGIATNVTNIAANTGLIATNGSDIADLQTDVGTNTTNIATNTGLISTNSSDIANKVSKTGDTMTGTLSNSATFRATQGFYINNDQSIFNYANYLHIYSGTGTAIELGGGISGRQNNVNVGNGYIYTSQGLRVGGAGTANELDDYEEGTYNFAFTLFKLNTSNEYNSSSFDSWTNNSTYIKVGRKVTLFINLSYTNPTPSAWSDSSLNVGLGNLPFYPSQLTGDLFPVGGTWSFDSNYQTNVDTNNAFVCMYGGYNNYGNFIALGGGIKSSYPNNRQYGLKATELPRYNLFSDTFTKVRLRGVATYYTNS